MQVATTAKQSNVTAQLDALFDQVGADALCLPFARALAEAHGLNRTSAGIRFYRRLAARVSPALGNGTGVVVLSAQNDTSWTKVNSVKAFGDVKTRAVVDWRMSCKRRFMLNPLLAVPEADKTDVRARFAAKRRVFEVGLSAGIGELQQFRREAARKTTALWPLIMDASQKLAQAIADLAVL
jgi:DNA-binding helix-hairpin-helix protein with protein kinase domain